MTVTVTPGRLIGSLRMPPSKSMMQRLCAAIWAKGGELHIQNPGISADDEVLLRLLADAGAMITRDTYGALQISITKAAGHLMREARFGESGLAARMCIPLLALPGTPVTLRCDESLSRRPMSFFTDVLPQIGVEVTMSGGRLPGRIGGRLAPKDIVVDGSISSQFITGLLLAYSAAGARGVGISVVNLVSRPYLRMTLDVMKIIGLATPEWRSDDTFLFHDFAQEAPGRPLEVIVEGDWSAAAFWLVAGAIAGPLSITGLDVFSAQGDKAMLQALMECGAGLSVEAGHISVRPAPLKAFQFDATDTPDLFPPLAVLAAAAGGTSVIAGVSRLRQKESDRAATIIGELSKMGADIFLQDDLMIIRGGQTLGGAALNAHGDHRIAMMGAIAALAAVDTTTINGAEAVSKSYPAFFADMEKAGGRVARSE